MLTRTLAVAHGLTNLAYNQLMVGQYEPAQDAIAQALAALQDHTGPLAAR